MDAESQLFQLRKEVKQLKLKLRDRAKTIDSFKRMADLREIHETITRKEILDLKETIDAQANVISMSAGERQEATQYMDVFRTIQDLSQDELRHKNLTLEQILKINKEITRIPKKEILLSKILDSIMPVLKAERGILFLEKDGKFTPAFTRNIARRDVLEAPFAECRAQIHKVLREKKGVTASVQPQAQPGAPQISLVCTLLREKEKLLGVLYLDAPLETHYFARYDLETVEIFSGQVSIAIANSNLYYELESEVLSRTEKLRTAYEKINTLYEDIEQDLNLARRIQTSMMPHDPGGADSLDVTIEYRPMSQIGGDIFDVHALDPGRVRILLADATGHGIQAALVTMLIKAEYEKYRKEARHPDDLLFRLNNEFFRKYHSLTLVFSMVIADIDLREGCLSYAAGGHIDQYLLCGAQPTTLGNTGKIIGLVEDAEYTRRELPFGLGDRLLLFTDGLTEEINARREMFGDLKLDALIQAHSNKAGRNLVRELLGELNRFMGAGDSTDDLTLLCVEQVGPSDLERVDRRTPARDRRASPTE